MLNQDKLAKFAELSLKIGVNLQPNQEVYIRSQIECAEFARTIAETAYKLGAKKVYIDYSDEKMTRIMYDYETPETLKEIPSWLVDIRNKAVDKKMAVISIASENPSMFAGVAPEKIKAYNVALKQSYKYFYDCMMGNGFRWLVISVPTTAWAEKVFPNDENAVDKLWDAIGNTMRLDYQDPTKEWKKHIETLNRRAEFLNKNNFDYIHMTSKNGTDLKVGLSIGHIWTAAQEEAQDGIPFTANMPTEEIFTAPHKYKVNGIVHNALPLVNKGNIIDDFSITFKDGRIVDYTAKVGLDALKNIIETDEGSHYLGEIALIGKNSPIAKSGIMFYNTLFDENASCHLAFGKGYPTTVKNGNDLNVLELDKIGVNDSIEHCDFMVGTKDMNIVGVSGDKEVTLFVDGEWVI